MLKRFITNTRQLTNQVRTFSTAGQIYFDREKSSKVTPLTPLTTGGKISFMMPHVAKPIELSPSSTLGSIVENIKGAS